MLENEADLYGEKAEECADILDTIDSPFLKMAFDPANFVCAGQRPFDECLPLVRKHIEHFHIKDAILGSKEITLPGEGDGQLPQLVKALVEDNYEGFITMESRTYRKRDAFQASPVPERFAEAVNAFRKIMDADYRISNIDKSGRRLSAQATLAHSMPMRWTKFMKRT